MSAAIDHTGVRYGRLIAIERACSKNNKAMWLVRCDCGKEKVVTAGSLTRGYTKSCGCLQRELAAKKAFVHGEGARGRITKLYNSWRGMNERCSNSHHKDFKYYGGKGIKITWDCFTSFREWAIENGYEEGLVIDRINSSQNYQPENCQWITASENTSRRNAPLRTTG